MGPPLWLLHSPRPRRPCCLLNTSFAAAHQALNYHPIPHLCLAESSKTRTCSGCWASFSRRCRTCAKLKCLTQVGLCGCQTEGLRREEKGKGMAGTSCGSCPPGAGCALLMHHMLPLTQHIPAPDARSSPVPLQPRAACVSRGVRCALQSSWSRCSPTCHRPGEPFRCHACTELSAGPR